MPNTKKKQINKFNFARVLATETAPFDTPIIFSNDGFFSNCSQLAAQPNSIDSFIFESIVGGLEKNQSTIPYDFKIMKNDSSFRKLSLIHPATQWHIKEFYEKYDTLICHYCSVSKFSIRSPQRVASAFYHRNPSEDLNKYKKGNVNQREMDEILKHSSSYFSYRGYSMLYKFFNSKEYLNLEKEFKIFLSIDISKCFPSIYTHSICWALKSKEFAKRHIGVPTFGHDFDSLMQKANFNETNGILVGPEVSRIFAEIILQHVDVQVERRLEGENLSTCNRDYEVRRYIDDIFIFAKDEAIANRVHNAYADILLTYNLHLNIEKRRQMTRPFFTDKSIAIAETNEALEVFFSKFLTSQENSKAISPVKIYNIDRLSRSLIDSLKKICTSRNVGYQEVSSYTISSLLSKLILIIEAAADLPNEESVKNYRDSILTIVEAALFLYSMAPSVSSSYKLCQLLILSIRFSEKKLPNALATIQLRIYELCLDTLIQQLSENEPAFQHLVSLEVQNLILALSELDSDHLLPQSILETMLKKDPSYFSWITCLFYCKNHVKYHNLRKIIELRINEKLGDLKSIRKKAETASIFLDSVCCPHISETQKIKWIKKLYKAFGKPIPSTIEIMKYTASNSTRYWFVNWKEIDLLNTLERKSLKSVY